ncbi:FAR1-related protein [Striga asiatica]|uniref:FAR1-related protein n=1 Tax=Striga asiatica TaxID=4170 RepID=A0A5A7QVL7_STRAF|nr:FAR1-related protein [Striga asiatica]
MKDENFVPTYSENANSEESANFEDNKTEMDDSIPKVGMQFPSENEVYDFYMRYAYATGFPVRKEVWGGMMMEFYDICEGRKNSSAGTSMKPQPISNTGCKARISVSLDIHVDGHMGTRYEVCEDVMCGDRRKKKIFDAWFNKEINEVSCSCLLFEHAITVMIHDDFVAVPDRYILRRWRKDINRAHTRVAVSYDGLGITPAQKRYDDMGRSFEEVADLAADDEEKYVIIRSWIKNHKKELILTKHSYGDTNTLHCTSRQAKGNENIKDPKASKRKGAPRTKRKKAPLEVNSNKSKVRLRKVKKNDPIATPDSITNQDTRAQEPRDSTILNLRDDVLPIQYLREDDDLLT